jgi:hypothetical protein
MAIFDAMLEFSDNQAITTDADSTNVVDFSNTDLEMGAGEPVWLNIRVGATDFDSAGDNGTLQFGLYSHTATTSLNSGTLLWQSSAIAEASLTAGAWITRIPLPYNCDENRYLGIYYNQTNTFTAGNVDAWLDHGPQSSYDTQVTTSNI